MEPSERFTHSLRKEDVQREWFVVDAAGKTLGRLSTQIATILRGKHKPSFTPHVDNGDFVIVLNAEKVVLEGKRPEKKDYFHYTGYPGGGISESFKELIKTKPERVIQHAVTGMLPKTKLGKQIIKKLKVYAGEAHPHTAQQPKQLTLHY